MQFSKPYNITLTFLEIKKRNAKGKKLPFLKILYNNRYLVYGIIFNCNEPINIYDVHAQSARKLKKVEAKKTREIKYIIFTNLFFTKIHFWQFQKYPNINF